MQPHILTENPCMHKARCHEQQCKTVLSEFLSLHYTGIEGQSVNGTICPSSLGLQLRTRLTQGEPNRAASAVQVQPAVCRGP